MFDAASTLNTKHGGANPSAASTVGSTSSASVYTVMLPRESSRDHTANTCARHRVRESATLS